MHKNNNIKYAYMYDRLLVKSAHRYMCIYTLELTDQQDNIALNLCYDRAQCYPKPVTATKFMLRQRPVLPQTCHGP